MKTHLHPFAVVISLLTAVFPLHAAEQIIFGNIAYTIDTLAFYPVGPSTDYLSLRFVKASNGTGGIDAFIMRMDMSNPLLRMEQVLGKEKVIGTETVSSMGKRLNMKSDSMVYFAGTNGDFFATSGDVGRPTGLTIGGGEFAYMPSNLKARRLGAVNEQMRGAIGAKADWSGNVIVHQDTLVLSHVNYTRYENELVLYNHHNGATTLTNAYGTELEMELMPGEKWHTNCTVKAIVRRKEVNKGSMSIADGHVVLSGHGTMATALEPIQVGDTLTVNMRFTMDDKLQNISECIGGDNYNLVLDNGIVVTNNFWNELHPRTAFGQSLSGDTLYFLVVDGRTLRSAGCTTQALGAMLKHYGAWKGVNWDGGGSSHLWLKNVGMLNAGCETSERAVGNGMFVYAQVPASDTVITHLEGTAHPMVLPQYGTYRPTVIGYNQYGILVNPDVAGVELSCDPEVGYITSDGQFVCLGSGLLHLRCGDVSGDISIRMQADVPMTYKVHSLLIDDIHRYQPTLQTTLCDRTVPLHPSHITWTITNPDILQMHDDFTIIGIANGSCDLVAQVGSQCDTMHVTVEIAPMPVSVLDSMTNPTTWNASESSKALNATLGIGPDGAMQLSCSYSGGRTAQLRIAKTITLYGLPEKIELNLDANGMLFSAVRCFLKPSDAAAAIQYNMIQDSTKTSTYWLNITETFAKYGDITYFPLKFDNLTFVLDSKTPHKSYQVLFGGLYLHYAQKPMDIQSVEVFDHGSPTKSIKDGQLYIRHNNRYYSILGQPIE